MRTQRAARRDAQLDTRRALLPPVKGRRTSAATKMAAHRREFPNVGQSS
jgi:hypothetical protein